MMAGDTRPLVLLLEPDTDTAEMYAEYFGMHEWRAQTAADGAAGLAKAIALRPDVITTETRLPIVDGFRTIQILKADPETASIPVIAVTGDTRDEYVRRLKEAGCSAVLAKPCLPETLLDRLREALTLARSLRARKQALRDHATSLRERSAALHARSLKAQTRARAVSVRTATPDILPPPLNCPSCAALLEYDYSIVGGVVTCREQWDYLTCPRGCGVFQYRPRTRRVRPA